MSGDYIDQFCGLWRFTQFSREADDRRDNTWSDRSMAKTRNYSWPDKQEQNAPGAPIVVGEDKKDGIRKFVAVVPAMPSDDLEADQFVILPSPIWSCVDIRISEEKCVAHGPTQGLSFKVNDTGVAPPVRGLRPQRKEFPPSTSPAYIVPENCGVKQFDYEAVLTDFFVKRNSPAATDGKTVTQRTADYWDHYGDPTVVYQRRQDLCDHWLRVTIHHYQYTRLLIIVYKVAY